ncbi:putative RNA-binding Zn-ribbon protein involved in translation (DUF1610 family) [Chitinivorax tropicus]|uniref:Putative RNA-binding Zn-ribbon protein involved in translation (DUF1610 family) n=1 Tax=Chitinivorax tropicus TaxID=714531 RepID=A0A840ML58_9PROT|nr:hypothetical protein [Chitinivorax tropicus]MBB5017869.1 putative RNA-binding Zn-ribbon protein involved in translation (DUF1610 family) [Chitinivorax tropicus]
MNTGHPPPDALEPDRADPQVMSAAADIILKFNSQEPGAVDLCQKYWLVINPPHFHYAIEQLANEFGLDVKAIHKVVGHYCTAAGEHTHCGNCGKAIIYRNRTTYKQVKSYLLSDWICRDCFVKSG